MLIGVTYSFHAHAHVHADSGVYWDTDAGQPPTDLLCRCIRTPCFPGSYSPVATIHDQLHLPLLATSLGRPSLCWTLRICTLLKRQCFTSRHTTYDVEAQWSGMDGGAHVYQPQPILELSCRPDQIYYCCSSNVCREKLTSTMMMPMVRTVY